MKALIIATFGSTHEDALRRDLDPVVEDLKKLAEGIPTRVAFTSRMVINRYEKRPASATLTKWKPWMLLSTRALRRRIFSFSPFMSSRASNTKSLPS